MPGEVLTVSSKGQIVLPAAFRKQMSITAGTKLASYMAGDVIILTPIKLPSVDDFKAQLQEAREWAASVGYQEAEINDIIKSVRKKNRK